MRAKVQARATDRATARRHQRPATLEAIEVPEHFEGLTGLEEAEAPVSQRQVERRAFRGPASRGGGLADGLSGVASAKAGGFTEKCVGTIRRVRKLSLVRPQAGQHDDRVTFRANHFVIRALLSREGFVRLSRR